MHSVSHKYQNFICVSLLTKTFARLKVVKHDLAHVVRVI